MNNKNFNLIITGVGGQGVITLIAIIDQAAMLEGYDVKSSELHGLSQRGGSVQAHIRFGKKVFSPLVPVGKADLILGLEMLEALRVFVLAGKQTKFVVNKYSFPFLGGISEKEILKLMPKNNLYLAPASEVCKKELANEVESSVYLLGYALAQKIIPLKKESVIQAIKNIMPQKYHQLNIKALELSYGN